MWNYPRPNPDMGRGHMPGGYGSSFSHTGRGGNPRPVQWTSGTVGGLGQGRGGLLHQSGYPQPSGLPYGTPNGFPHPPRPVREGSRPAGMYTPMGGFTPTQPQDPEGTNPEDPNQGRMARRSRWDAVAPTPPNPVPTPSPQPEPRLESGQPQPEPVAGYEAPQPELPESAAQPELPAEIPQPVLPQADERADALEEKIARLETLLVQITNAERRPPQANLFQSPSGPEYKVGQSLFKRSESASPTRQRTADQLSGEGGSGPVDDRLVKKWMREVKTFDPTRESFRTWLVKAELRMGEGWDVEMRLNYLRSKLDLAEIIKLDQITQLMEAQGKQRTWQAIRERALQVFPGAIDPDAAEFKLLAQHQGEGEPFGKWVDRVTKLYVEMVGEMPQPGSLDEIIFSGARIEYKKEWRTMQPQNLLDARWRLTQWEEKKWQELGLPNPAEAESGVVHIAAGGGITVHPDRADLMRDHQSAVHIASDVKGPTQVGQQDGKQVAGPQPQRQAERSPGKKGRRWHPRKPAASDGREAEQGPRERITRGDQDAPVPARERGNAQDRRPTRRPRDRSAQLTQRPTVKEARPWYREERKGPPRREWSTRNRGGPPPQQRPAGHPGGPRRWDRGHVIAQGPRPVTQCGFCGREGHVMRTCRDVSCFNCGRRGHLSVDCRTRQAGHAREPRPGGNNRTPAYTAVVGAEGAEPSGQPSAITQQIPPRQGASGQQDAMSEVARTAKILSEQLQTLSEPKFPTIFPY